MLSAIEKGKFEYEEPATQNLIEIENEGRKNER